MSLHPNRGFDTLRDFAPITQTVSVTNIFNTHPSVPAKSVKELLGHASITTTIDTYGHLTVEDARATLQAAGWFTGREVRL